MLFTYFQKWLLIFLVLMDFILFLEYIQCMKWVGVLEWDTILKETIGLSFDPKQATDFILSIKNKPFWRMTTVF